MPSEKPILFSGPMVRAILEGRKTQTRRIANHGGYLMECGAVYWAPSPYQPGDLLWVRENYKIQDYTQPNPDSLVRMWGRYEADQTHFEADLTPEESAKFWKWKKKDGLKGSIYMFKSLSRIWLRVTDVRCERVQNISEEDAVAEGIKPEMFGLGDYGYEWAPEEDGTGTARESFQRLWDSINAKRPGCSWEANPFVWAYTFERVEKEER